MTLQWHDEKGRVQSIIPADPAASETNRQAVCLTAADKPRTPAPPAPASPRRPRGLLLAGALLTGLTLLACLVSLVWTPYDPTAMDHALRFAAPSLAHPFGCDQWGRDILSRTIAAAQPALLVGLGSVAIGAAAGVALGSLAGMASPRVRAALMRFVDGLMAFPGILLAMVLVLVLGRGLRSVLVAVAAFMVPTFARLTCQTTLELRGSLFIKAARSNGCAGVRLFVRHVLPNIAPRLVTQFTASAGAAMLLEASLSFLGLGVQPPLASWGYMLNEAFSLVLLYPGLAVAPGLALVAAVLGFNLLGDGLNDLLVAGGAPAAAPAGPEPAAEKPGAFDLGPTGPALGSLGDPCMQGDLRGADGIAGAPAPTGPLALDLRDLRLRSAEGRELVRGVSLAVAPGELVALVGESGSGKTLTARTCLGLVPRGVSARAERVCLAGEDVLALDRDGLRRLLGTCAGFVPQNTMAYLQPSMRVEAQLVDGYRTWHKGSPRREAVARAAELLAAVGFEDPRRVLRSYPGELSGGQRQRVNIAMALMNEPQIVVADEPTAALDSVTAAQVVELLVRVVRERGTALLLISHDLGLVRRRCDRTYVMRAGRIVEEGATASVLSAPQHPYTRELLAAIPRVPHDFHHHRRGRRGVDGGDS